MKFPIKNLHCQRGTKQKYTLTGANHSQIHTISQRVNEKILRFPTLTHRTHLLNYLRFYWTTWEFTELPQNLLNYLTIYWTTWEFTELPHNLLNYLRIYWTTSQFTELPQIFTELPQIFTELPQILTELPGFLQVKIIELPGPAEVY